MPAIFGAQDQIEGTGDETAALVAEPHIQQGLIGALLGEQFGILFQALRLRVIGVFRVAVMLEQQRRDLPAVELLAPGLARIAAVQDHAFMTHSPALAGTGEHQGGQVGTDRHLGLNPGRGVVGKQNVAALTGGNQPATGLRQGVEWRMDRLAALHRGHIQGRDKCRLRERLARQ
ncbi:hypothetical protein D3C78_1087470 [compost metagenome]